MTMYFVIMAIGAAMRTMLVNVLCNLLWDDSYFLFCLIMLANIIIIIAAIIEARKGNGNNNTPSTT